MGRSVLRWIAVVPLFLLLVTSVARAGQRRVDVGLGGSITFTPPDATLNVGDHVTWVWDSGAHSVTSGLDGNDAEAGAIFDSGILSFNSLAPQAFSWKADQTGTIPFFCSPHWAFGMLGSLAASASGVSISSFRITEVQYNDAAGHDRIEIANLGDDTGDLGRYRIAVNGASSVLVPLNSVVVIQGHRVVIHTNEPGLNAQTDLYMGGIGDLPATGSVALYVPNTKPGTLLTDATQIIDFVQWGAGSQANASTALSAGVWPSTAQFVDPVPATGNYDITFCGTPAEFGKAFWNVAHPNFNTGVLCSTPTHATTWGRIKLLYR